MADTNSVAGTAIAKLDRVILSLLEQREQLVALTRAPAIEGEDSFNPPAPFVRPLAGDLERVKPFQQLGTGFSVGFDKDSGAAVTVRQKPKSDPYLSPPDYHYSLEAEIVDPGAAKWITLEWKVGRIGAIEPSVLSVGMKAVASSPQQVRLEFSIPRSGAPQKRVSLGQFALGTEFDFASVSKRITVEDFDGADLDRSASLLMFLPVTKCRLELAFLRVLLSPA